MIKPNSGITKLLTLGAILLITSGVSASKDVTIYLEETSTVDPAELSSSLSDVLSSFESADTLDSAALDSMKTEDKFRRVSLARVDSLFRASNIVTDINTVRPVKWTGNGCGYVMDNLFGLTYGFFPFWKNGAAAEPINFSVYRRIAYYGFSFTSRGQLFHINDTLVPGEPFAAVLNDSGFIQEAHRHGTKVDWVIAKDEWSAFNDDTARVKKCFSVLADSLKTLLAPPVPTFAERVKQVLSLGIWKPTRSADGITLYIRNYFEDPAMMKLFREFVTEVNHTAAKYSGTVSLMISQEEFLKNRGICGVSFLNSLFTEIDHEKREKRWYEPYFDKLGVGENPSDLSIRAPYLLLVMNSEAPKELHRLRMHLDGISAAETRQNILRRIVPVFSGCDTSKRSIQILQNNLIYTSDTYYGVGVVPHKNDTAVTIPDSAKDAASLTASLAHCFIENETSGTPKPKLIRLFEENRILFRTLFAWNIILGCLLFIILKLIPKKELGAFPVTGFLLLFSLILPIIQFTVLLNLDPDWKSLKEGNSPLYMALAVLIGSIIYIILYRKSKQEIPSRASLREAELRGIIKTQPNQILPEDKK